MITVTIIAVNATPQQLQTDFNDHRQLLEIKCTSLLEKFVIFVHLD